MRWYRAACPACHGDLFDDVEDEGWVTCFSCSRSFEATNLGLGGRDQKPTPTTPSGRLTNPDTPSQGASEGRSDDSSGADAA